MKNVIELYCSITFNGLILTIFQNRGDMTSFFMSGSTTVMVRSTLLPSSQWDRASEPQKPVRAFLLNYRSSKFSALPSRDGCSAIKSQPYSFLSSADISLSDYVSFSQWQQNHSSFYHTDGEKFQAGRFVRMTKVGKKPRKHGILSILLRAIHDQDGELYGEYLLIET